MKHTINKIQINSKNARTLCKTDTITTTNKPPNKSTNNHTSKKQTPKQNHQQTTIAATRIKASNIISTNHKKTQLNQNNTIII